MSRPGGMPMGTTMKLGLALLASVIASLQAAERTTAVVDVV